MSKRKRDSSGISSEFKTAERGDNESGRRAQLAQKLEMLQKEERSLKSLLTELRSQQSQLKIEKVRLESIVAKNVKAEPRRSEMVELYQDSRPMDDSLSIHDL
ncbi:hypothetical protein DdX_11598 [Ditylenchus destructor]|uniref:Uncharacterized protein n=1 Tax=Ditylenchus destructor TaxID=166010 RepID=A0AAD4R4E2_9BILA|nr:hypothetical protein DdX_11598 [Ditylenchus destructor]